jgi:hypothetical protein
MYAATGVFVLTREFVTSGFPMEELQWFLERWKADHSCVSLIPVFLGLTVEECVDIRELYQDDETWQGKERPAEGVLQAWSEAIGLLCSFVGVRPKTVSDRRWQYGSCGSWSAFLS